MAVGSAYLFPPLSCGGASIAGPLLRFHTPLIEPDVQISRIRLSDKTSHLHPRHVVPKPGQAYELGLGGLEGELIAVDGLPVAPVRGRRFPIAIAQRLDIRLALPAGQGAYPVFAHREGDTARTGILLATSGARIERLADHAGHKAPVVGLDLERRLAAVHPLGPRPADRTHVVDLTGSMKGYIWGLNGVVYGDHTPLELRQGERIELAFRNKTMMSHPMHMHGVPFQVVEIDGERFQGAMRDTVLVPANGGRVTVAFDAVNPGTWVHH